MVSFFILFTVGIVGGFIEYLKSTDEHQNCLENENGHFHCRVHLWIKKTMIALAASFMVPLFLKIIGNGEVGNYINIELFSTHFYYLIGFGLIASIYSSKFIETVSDKILKDIKKNEDDIVIINKENKILKKQLTESQIDTKLTKVEVYINEERYDKAIEDMDEILELNPTIKQKATTLVNKAYVVKRMKNDEEGLNEALKIINKVLEFKPNDHDALYNRACYNSLLGNYQAVSEDLEKLVELNREYFDDFLKDKDAQEFMDSEEFKSLGKKYDIISKID
jgi:tetratricopeptide (TPR) repeat protein